jgi:hypothetical protein
MPSWRAIASGVVSFLLISVTGRATAPASREADPAFARQNVAYATHEAPGTIYGGGVGDESDLDRIAIRTRSTVAAGARCVT